jgi:2-oxo-4-hydroxy-4-carboxy-5-ureidoimidazoline decarboxylase
LIIANNTYENKFGFIFIVCATGKTAVEMLELLNERLNNDAEKELNIAAREQNKITHLRIDKLIS